MTRSTRRPTRHRLAAAAAAAGLAVTLTACSGTGETGTSAPGATQSAQAAHNATDTWFAQMMIVHHEGAVEMADLAVERATTPEVRALAERITAAQGPEIELMSGWLEAWGEEQPDGMDMGGMDHGGMDMDGMDQTGAMRQLEGLEGEDLDRRFLELMTAHHEGAIMMAEEEQADGSDPDAVALAGRIIEDQRAEIAEMERLLDGL